MNHDQEIGNILKPGAIFGQPIEYWVNPKIQQEQYTWNTSGTDSQIQRAFDLEFIKEMEISRREQEKYNRLVRRELGINDKKEEINTDKKLIGDIIDL